MGQVFLDVREHAKGGSAFVPGFEKIDLGFPLPFWKGIGHKLLILGRAHSGLFFFAWISAPKIGDGAFLNHAFRPCSVEGGQPVGAA